MLLKVLWVGTAFGGICGVGTALAWLHYLTGGDEPEDDDIAW